jgi:hypothetical protein
MLAIVVAVFVHAMVEYPLHYTFFLFPVALLMGGISRITMPDATWRIPMTALVSAACALAVLLVLVFVDYSRQDDDMRAMRMKQARILERTPYAPTEPLLLWQLHSYMEFFRQPVRAGMTPEQLDDKGRVARRYPSGQNYLIWASALAMNDRPDEAREVLRRVCKLSDEPCERLQGRWRYFGEQTPAIAKVPWPPED